MQFIRNNSVVLHFQLFSSIKFDRMSAAFGRTIDEVESSVVNLIQTGAIQGHVDNQKKVGSLA